MTVKGGKKMDVRRKLVFVLLATISVAAVVNATAFAYRWLGGTITIAPATDARGAACTGFYSSAAQAGIPLPPAGTNYNAPTYGGNSISTTPGYAVCQFTSGGSTYYLYESVSATVKVTVGSWYIKDLYGFGYFGTSTDPKVYVYLRVEDVISGVSVAEAKLVVYKGGVQVGELDLKAANKMGPIELSPGEGLRLDLLFIGATSIGTANLKVGFYATQESGEAPW